MRPTTVVALLAGLALVTGLVLWQGLGTVAEMLAQAGWQLLWLVPLHVIPLAMAALSWRLLFPAANGPGPWATLNATWIGTAVNWLLPVAQVGGELVKARLVIGNDVPASSAMATVVVDKTVQAITVPLFALVGVAALVFASAERDLLIAALGFSLLLSAGIYGFYRVQKAGIFGGGARIVERVSPWPIGTRLVAGGENTDLALGEIYDRRKRLGVSLAWRMASRVAIAAEIWLILYFLGEPVGIAEAVVLESLGGVAIALGFAIPGALGVQEGGFMLLAAALGLGPETGLALSLTRRVRELLVGGPGLLVWQVVEGRNLLSRRAMERSGERGQ